MSSRNPSFINKLKQVNNLEIIESQSDIKRLSKDFYNYSPILTEKLDGCIADLVVRPSDHNAVKRVAEICWEFSIPLTLRGSGSFLSSGPYDLANTSSKQANSSKFMTSGGVGLTYNDGDNYFGVSLDKLEAVYFLPGAEGEENMTSLKIYLDKRKEWV